MIEGDFESAPLARTLAVAASAPVMLLYICDDDDWGYDFYAGDEEDHFCTIDLDEKQHLAGNPAMPVLKEILEQNLPPVQKDLALEEQSLLYALPSAL